MPEDKENVLDNIVKEEEKKTREDIVNNIIKDLEKGIAPWRKGNHPPEMAYNYINDKPYQGLNAINLTFSNKGSTDPRWLTYKQAQELGMNVRKGEKGESVIFFRIYDTKEKCDLDKEKFAKMNREEQEAYKKNIKLINTRWTVFNGSQIDGMPAYERKNTKQFTLNELEKKLIEKSPAPIKFDGGDKNFYRPLSDTIHLAPMENFISKERFVSTLCHEISHSTGHESRLNRDLINQFGTEKYAKEELIAELATVFTMTECGLRTDPSIFENNKAYINSWISALKDDVSILNKVSIDSGKACDFIKTNILEMEKINQNIKNKEIER